MMNFENKIRAILVDDEIKANKILKYQLEKHCPEVEVVGIAHHVDEAKKIIQELKPNVVFLDIEMPEKSGFQLFQEMTVDFHTIFVTAYNQYALRAFEVSAIDYLLKPLDIARLKQAVQKAIKAKENQLARIKILQTNLEQGKIEQIVLPFKEYKMVVKTKDIICIEAKRSYSDFYFIKDEQLQVITYYRNLNYFADLLSEYKYFFRVHRSWIINLKKITKLIKKELIIEMEMNVRVNLSKSKIKEFEDRIK